MINEENKNMKCLIFRYKEDYTKYKLLVFKTKAVAKQYYKVALRKPNFVYAETYYECIKWLKFKNYNYDVIERDHYNVYE